MSDIIEYKCPQCGGSIEFDSGIQKMKCPYCDAEFEIEALKQFDEDIKNTEGNDMTWDSAMGAEWTAEDREKVTVLVCDNCGGEVVGDATMAASSCPYCDSPIIVKGAIGGELKPDYVIPFKLDKKAAIEGLKKHFMGKKLLPKAFNDENHLEEIKGVYVPFWLFSASSNANVRYKATKLHTWSDSNYIYTQKKFFSCYRSGSIAFENIPEDGSSKMPDDLMESLEPFYFKDAVDFQTAYLSGYLADKYDVAEEECVDRANLRIKQSTEQEFAGTVKGYSSVVAEDSNISFEHAEAKYALYPVWLLNTTWNGQKFVFAMNGQTGKFVGDLPMDKSLRNKYFLLSSGIVAAVVMLVQFLLWMI